MTDLRFSPYESARFGLRVFRAEAERVNADALVAALRRERVDVAILRLPAESIASLQSLRAYDLAPIVADTIVGYEGDLTDARNDVDETVVLRDATPADRAQIELLARDVFAGYVTHYHANPLFAPTQILDGYAEWAARHTRENRTGESAWIVESNGEVAGFSCYRIDRAAGVAIGVLNGVLPAFRRRGVYRRMLGRMLHAFAAQGLRRFVIATQVQNVAVQRIWVSQGLSLRRADNTVHVNALYGQAELAVEGAGAAPAATLTGRPHTRKKEGTT